MGEHEENQSNDIGLVLLISAAAAADERDQDYLEPRSIPIYFPPRAGFFKYLKNSELGSMIIISLLCLKLCL